MAQKIANHKAANDAKSASDDSASNSTSLEKAAELFELALEEDPEPETSSEDDGEEAVKFGMGRIG